MEKFSPHQARTRLSVFQVMQCSCSYHFSLFSLLVIPVLQVNFVYLISRQRLFYVFWSFPTTCWDRIIRCREKKFALELDWEQFLHWMARQHNWKSVFRLSPTQSWYQLSLWEKIRKWSGLLNSPCDLQFSRQSFNMQLNFCISHWKLPIIGIVVWEFFHQKSCQLRSVQFFDN